MEITLAPTVSTYYLDRSLVSLIIGPVGSGKTLGSIAKLESLMYEQEPSSDGIRYSRIAIVRNTYQELKDTTIKSFLGFFTNSVKMNWANLSGVYQMDDIHCEFLFRSLDKPDDMRKLLSLEITHAYLNEMRELPKETLENIISRLGRYPSKKDGVGCTQSCVVADSNAFADSHWIYNLFFTVDKPVDYSVFVQPPAVLDNNEMNPEAENVENLPKEYYKRQLRGASENFIDIMLKVKFISPRVGKPVYPEFNYRIHTVDFQKIGKPNPELPLVCGGDNGRWSGFLVGQVDPLGRIVIFDELLSDDMSLSEFSDMIKEHMKQNYSEYRFSTWIDPWVSNQRGQLTDMTMFKLYSLADLDPRTSMTRSPETMVEAVKKKFNTISVGQPALIISTKCKELIKGLNGGYSYRRVNVSGEKYKEKPDKGRYSHICNSLEFLVDGTGASRELLRTNRFPEPIKADTKWSPV